LITGTGIRNPVFQTINTNHLIPDCKVTKLTGCEYRKHVRIHAGDQGKNKQGTANPIGLKMPDRKVRAAVQVIKLCPVCQ
jgi:hypothetical protein